ncbi:DUF397 domain-containing protein [Streptomyces decoyicus]
MSAEPALRAPRPEQAWRKSSYSSGGGNCIVATAFGAGTVAVHDSKNPAWTRPVRRLRGVSCPITAHALPEGCYGEPAAGAERCAHGGGAGLPLAVPDWRQPTRRHPVEAAAGCPPRIRGWPGRPRHRPDGCSPIAGAGQAVGARVAGHVTACGGQSLRAKQRAADTDRPP